MTIDPIVADRLAQVIIAAIAGFPAIMYARAALKQGVKNGEAQVMTAEKADTAAISAGIAAVKAGHAAERADTAAGLAQDANSKQDTIIAGNEAIHKLVNSGSDLMKQEIASLKAELVRANERTDKLAATIDILLQARVVNAPLVDASGTPIKVEVVNTPLEIHNSQY